MACGGSDGSTTSGAASSSAGTGGGVSHTVMLRIDPPMASLDVALTNPATASFHAFATVDGLPESDVTMGVQWSVGGGYGTVDPNGTFQPAGIGGKTAIQVAYEGATASAPLTLKLKGDLFLTGTDPAMKNVFDGATVDTDSTHAPVLEYPEDGTVMPANLPPVEAQWSIVAGNAVHRVHLVSPETLDVTVYSLAGEILYPADLWSTIGQSRYDQTISWTVEGLSAGQKRLSTPRTMTISADKIDQSAIYVWQSSSGSFRVLDMEKGTDIALPTNAPQLAGGQPCSGCHRVSRDGKRFAYTFNGGDFEFGSLAYDEASKSYQAKIAPAASYRATYAAFNPIEATTKPAMLLTLPDTVPQNTAGTVHLDLVDPDTGATIASDLASAMATIDPSVGHATSMPDWSPAGDFVVFSAYDSNTNYVRLLGDDIVKASIVEMPVSWDGASFHFGAPKVLVHAAPGANPDTDENNLLPTISPDGGAVAFTRAAGWWSIKTQASQINLSGQIAVVRRSDGQVLELVHGSNGPGTTLSSTWPQWAPTVGARYTWLAFGTERPYGHRLTPASPENAQCSLVQGQKQCKHLWVMAIDRTKLASGTDDPSFAPFYIPGQTLAAQYVSPQWTKSVIVPQ